MHYINNKSMKKKTKKKTNYNPNYNKQNNTKLIYTLPPSKILIGND